MLNHADDLADTRDLLVRLDAAMAEAAEARTALAAMTAERDELRAELLEG